MEARDQTIDRHKKQKCTDQSSQSKANFTPVQDSVGSYMQQSALNLGTTKNTFEKITRHLREKIVRRELFGGKHGKEESDSCRSYEKQPLKLGKCPATSSIAERSIKSNEKPTGKTIMLSHRDLMDTFGQNDVSDADDDDVINNLHTCINLIASAIDEGTGQWVREHNKGATQSYSDDEEDFIPDNNHSVTHLEGYCSDTDATVLYIGTIPRCREIHHTTGFLFEDNVHHKMIMRQGQLFRDEFQFRRAVEVFSLREGFKLCIIENGPDLIHLECSLLRCDWKIVGAKISTGNSFIVKDISLTHACHIKRAFKCTSKWIAANYLHLWKQNPETASVEVKQQIIQTFGVVCPEWKIFKAEKRAQQLLGKDHVQGYTRLTQLKTEIERINSHNIVVLETKDEDSGCSKIFHRMFVCFHEPAFTFKMNCRNFIAVDGWVINSVHKSVMLVAAALDGNNDILPIALAEVEIEDFNSWYFFLNNLIRALRRENGEGLCIITDGDNGVLEAIEDCIPLAHCRQCCCSIYNQMLVQFPDPPVKDLFWAACRSTSEVQFTRYIKMIQSSSIECHQWLFQTQWKKWALHCMPVWVKCTNVTIMLTVYLRNSFAKFFSLSIADRFAAISSFIADTYERRRLSGWNWLRNKITPSVQQQIRNRVIQGQQIRILYSTGRQMKVEDTDSMTYEVDITSMTCTCRLWQLSGIPCSHACRCLEELGENIEDNVHQLFSMDQYRTTYASGMDKLPERSKWQLKLCDEILPPSAPDNTSFIADDLYDQTLVPTQNDTKETHVEASGAKVSVDNKFVSSSIYVYLQYANISNSYLEHLHLS